MELSLSICLLLGNILDYSAAAALGGPEKMAHIPGPFASDQPRTLRTSAGSNQNGNMTVAFVPLISLIANLLPRFFTRYTPVATSNVQQARSFDFNQKQHEESQQSELMELDWLNKTSNPPLYQCCFSKSNTMAQKAFCLAFKRKKCKLSEIFIMNKKNGSAELHNQENLT